MIVKVLACGDRHWTDTRMIWTTLTSLHEAHRREAKRSKEPFEFVLIEGQAKGADVRAGQWAEAHHVRHRPMPAEWHRYGKGAGPMRNAKMLEKLLEQDGARRIVVAFHDAITESKGTANMLEQVEAANRNGAGIQVLLVHHEDALI